MEDEDGKREYEVLIQVKRGVVYARVYEGKEG